MDKTKADYVQAMLSDEQFVSTHLDANVTAPVLLGMDNAKFFRLRVLFTHHILHTVFVPRLRKLFRTHAAVIRSSTEIVNRMWIVWSDILADEGYGVIMQELFEMVLVAKHEGKHDLVEDLMQYSYELYSM